MSDRLLRFRDSLIEVVDRVSRTVLLALRIDGLQNLEQTNPLV